MKKTISLLLLLSVIFMPVKAQDVENVKPVKNVILLIPDGTSLATVSMARWLQWYTNPDKPKLNIDPYLCGTVRTHSSNAPIGDSAPTTSCYMTGQPSRTGYVSTYPENDGDNDIYPTGTRFPTTDNRPGSCQNKTGQINGTGFHLRIPACNTGRLLRPQLQPWQI